MKRHSRVARIKFERLEMKRLHREVKQQVKHKKQANY